jgi:hypothetical protein
MDMLVSVCTCSFLLLRRDSKVPSHPSTYSQKTGADKLRVVDSSVNL